METVKVLTFGLHDHLGGLENYMRNLVNYKDDERVHFDFAVSFPEMVYEDEYRSRGMETYHLPGFLSDPIGYYRSICSLLSRNEYDCVYYNMMSAANIMPLVAAKKSGVERIIAHAHNNGIPHGMLRRVLNSANTRRVSRYATDLWTNSFSSSEWMFGTRDGVELIQNAVDTHKLGFDPVLRFSVRENLGLGDALVIGNVARFEEQKNHAFLIDVFAEVMRRQENSTLLLVGKGELESDIRARAEGLGISDRVVFLGERRDIPDLLQAMDVFILPSLFDGLPLSVLEAQASGLPCLISTAIPEEICILSSARRMDISDGAGVWADAALLNTTTDREEASKQMQASKAEIRNQAPAIAERFLR